MWTRPAGATGYTIQISTTQNFTAGTIVKSWNVTSTQAQNGSAPNPDLTSLTAGTKYHWRILAYNATQSSDYSAGKDFTTAPAVTKLAIPTLNVPVNTKTFTAAEAANGIYLEWSQNTLATGYYVEIAENTAFNLGLIKQTKTGYANN